MALYHGCRKENGYESIMEEENQEGNDGSAGSASAVRGLERSNKRTDNRRRAVGRGSRQERSACMYSRTAKTGYRGFRRSSKNAE